MSREPSTPALDPLWREMSLPHYLKELRNHIEDAWEKDPATSAEAKKTLASLKKSGDGANVADAKKFLRSSVGIIIRRLKGEALGDRERGGTPPPGRPGLLG